MFFIPSALDNGAYITNPVLIAERALNYRDLKTRSDPKMYDPLALAVLHEFNNLLRPIKRNTCTSIMMEEKLKQKGIVCIGKGGFKTVYKFKNYAVCTVQATNARRERLVRNLQYLLRFPMKRDIFIYPIASFFSIELDMFYICMELCSHDMFEETFTKIEPILNNPSKLSKQIKKILYLFTQNNFLHRLSNEISLLHNVDDDNSGLFNFDIKFENFFVLNDSLRLGDIDGFGKSGSLIRFGTHTDTWCLSLYGGKGLNDEVVISKRLGCMNDLTAFALITFFIRLLMLDYGTFIKCYKENSVLTYGRQKGIYTNVEGQKCYCLKASVYKKKEDKADGKKNLLYVEKRAKVLIHLFKKYAITADGYSQPFENLLQAFKDISTLRFICVENNLSSNDIFINEYVKLKKAIFAFHDNTRDTFDVLQFRTHGRKRMKMERVSSESGINENCCHNQ